MKNHINVLLLTLFALVATSCASRITTANSTITTVYLVEKPEVVKALRNVVSGMDNYTLRMKTNGVAVVKYDPSNPLMGSASVRVNLRIASGITKDGQKVTGIELVYTDITPLLSQDTAFGGGDVIDRLKDSLAEYLEFKGIEHHQIQRTT